MAQESEGRVKRSRPRRQRKTSLASAKRKLWAVMSAYIKKRDGNTCISCGAKGLSGQNWHAGHLFSAGQYPAIRYNELNVHSQCSRCNIFLRGNVHEYFDGLYKLGKQYDYAILNERKSEFKQWRVPELEALREEYQKKLDALSTP